MLLWKCGYHSNIILFWPYDHIMFFWQKDAATLAQWIINGKRKLSIVPLEYHLEVGLHWYIKCTNLYDKPV